MLRVAVSDLCLSTNSTHKYRRRHTHTRTKCNSVPNWNSQMNCLLFLLLFFYVSFVYVCAALGGVPVPYYRAYVNEFMSRLNCGFSSTGDNAHKYTIVVILTAIKSLKSHIYFESVFLLKAELKFENWIKWRIKKTWYRRKSKLLIALYVHKLASQHTNQSVDVQSAFRQGDAVEMFSIQNFTSDDYKIYIGRRRLYISEMETQPKAGLWN